MYGHDSKHTFRTSLIGPADPNLLPTSNLGDKITTQITVSPTGMLVAGAGFAAWGIRADGRIFWRSKLAADAKLSSAAFDTDGFFYIGDRGNALNKYDYTTGQLFCRWINTGQDGDIRSSPTISVKFPDRVYVGESGVAGGFFAIQTVGSGACQPVWSLSAAEIPGGSNNSPALADEALGAGDAKGLIIQAAKSTIYAIQDNGTSATIAYKRDLNALVDGPSPVIDPLTGKIFIGSMTKHFYVLNPDFTDFIPPIELDSPIQATAALSPDGSTVYVPSYRGTLYAFDTVTGQVRPGFPVRMNGNLFHRNNAPAVDGAGNIYVVGTDRHVRGFHSDGSLFFDGQIGFRVTAPPTILDGSLVVGAWNGDVYRFCPPPSGPPTAENVCGFTVDTTSP